MTMIETMTASGVEREARDADRTPVHRATDLTRGGDLTRIVHGGQIYTLRITRQGKLILTK